LGGDWIDLAQDRDQWRVLVSIVMNLQFPENVGKFSNSSTSDGLLSSMEFVGWLNNFSFTSASVCFA
jgi:hypothetical protein